MKELLKDCTFTRSDEESLDLTAASKAPRIDDFDCEAKAGEYKEELSKISMLGDNILVVEDMSPRGRKVVHVKKRYYQFKGLVVKVGPEISLIKVGEYVIWGLYGGSHKVQVVEGLSTWRIKENNVLVKVDKDCALTE